MDSRIVKHFEDELAKLNAELKPFDDAMDKALDADKVVDDKDMALKAARDNRDDVKAALVFAEEKVALAEKELKDALDFADACKKEVVALKDDDKLAKRDEFMDILDGIEHPQDVCEDAAEPDVPEEEEVVVEEAPVVEEVKVEEPIVEEVKVEAKPEDDHKAVFDSLVKKRHITIK